MPSNSDLEAIGRIINAIKMYRDLTKDHRDSVDTEGVNTHLKRHLSLVDWLVWQRACGGHRVMLQADGIAYA